MNKTWAGAIAIFLGSIAGALIVKEIDNRRAVAIIQKMQADMAAEIEASNRASKEFQRQQIINTRAQERLRQAAIDERMAATAIQQKAEADRAQADFEAKNAEEAAWKKFHKPTPECSRNWTGDCADAFIVAKRAFKAQYKPGM